MASCAVCLHKNVHPNVCSDCLGGAHFKPRNRTEADKIRSMSDEELAHFLEMKAGRFVSFYPTPAKNWLDWLRQEAETCS